MDKDKKSEDIESDSDKADSSTSGGKRKRVSYNMEPRTPLKRQRIPVQRFQSPLEEQEAASSKAKIHIKEEPLVLYKKGIFLAVRGAEGTFYLCRTLQNISTTTKKFRIQWLSLDQPPNTYKYDYVDSTDIECVLTNVKMDHMAREVYQLPKEEQERVEKLLNKTLKIESGDIVEEELEEEQVKNEVEEDGDEWEDVNTPPKKKIKSTKGASTKTKAVTKSKPRTTGQKSKEKDKEKKQKEKDQKQKGKKARPDRNLKPNPKIKILEKDPFFEGKDPGPFISVPIQSRLAFTAVASDDVGKMKELIQSEKVYRLDLVRSPDVEKTPLEYAIENESKEMIELLLDDILKKENKRLQKGPPVTLLQATSTGEYNPLFLGIQNIRGLSVSRGSREGNNAFAKDKLLIEQPRYYVTKAIQAGVSPETLDFIIAAICTVTGETRDEVLDWCMTDVHFAIERGYRQLAAKLVADAVRIGGYGYNFLHEEVLKFNNEDLRDNILVASVRKKPFDNKGITPMHCAAINPNVKYLTRLLSVEPDVGMMDRSHRRLIHYAASCEGTGPLEFLLHKNANPNDADAQGNFPLHLACYSGRADNVSLLLKHAQSKGNPEDPTFAKWGIGGIDRPNRNSYCPVHIAIINGHMEVLRVLVKHKVNINKPLSASKNKVTPLMLASQRGYLHMARLLVQNGAVVEVSDKLKRTALTHAVMNGNTNVASYLLYLGADPNHADSSGNTLVHYAAAYGWYHCLKLLVKDAGANVSIENDWKTTPLAIAFLKGHTGIVDFLLNQPKTDINFKDEKGMTLVSIAASSRLQPGLSEQIDYLVKEKEADPTITDIEGYNALHHLCANNIKLKGNRWSPQISEEAMDTSVQIAETLLTAGCDLSLPTQSGKTPVALALEKVNYKLVQLLVDRGSVVPVEKNEEEKNILHMMAEQCVATPMTNLLYILSGQGKSRVGDSGDKEALLQGEEKMEVSDLAGASGDAGNVKTSAQIDLHEALKIMAADTDFLGFTPLLRACQVYRTYQVPRSLQPAQVERQQEDGREFIQALIEVAGSDINATVREKNIPDAKTPQYTEEGLYSAVHMMIATHSEIPVKEGEKEISNPGLRLVLQHNPNLELKNQDGHTPLVMSVYKRDYDKTSLLLEKGANPNVTFKYGSDGNLVTPVLYAAIQKDLPLVKLLLKHGADGTTVDTSNKYTLLHYLVFNGVAEAESLEIMKMLLQKGVSVNAKSKDGTTPLHIAVEKNTGSADASTNTEEFLLSQKADVFAKTDSGIMPLHNVFVNACGDPIELCSLLTAAMGDRMVDEPDSGGQTPLHLAAAQGATICCMHLLQRRALIGRKDSSGNSPLALAVKNKKDSCAIMLLQQGAGVDDEIVLYDPSVNKKSAETPTTPVCTTKKEKPILKWRPVQQQKKDSAERKREVYSVFQGAIYSDLQGIAHLLLDKTGIGFSAIEAALNVNKFNVALRLLRRVTDASKLQGKNSENQTLFHILAWRTRPGAQEELQLKVAEALLEKGVPTNTVDSHGCTPIHYCAIQHQPVPLARFLIENSKGFDVKAKDKMGRDLVSAVMWDYDWVSNASSKAMTWLDLLLEKGLSLDVLFDRPLADTLLFGARLDLPCPDYFSTKGVESISPLILAVRNYNFGLARYLLLKGANPNFKDSMGLTPLMHAVKINDLMLVKLLLNYDFNKDILDKPSELLGTRTKPVLEKRLSRPVFTIKPEKIVEEMEKDPSDEEDFALKERDEEDIDLGIEAEADVVELPEEEEIVEEKPEINGLDHDDDDEGEDDESGEDSDNDTDVIDDEEETVAVPVEESPPRLGSKQLSLARGTKKDKFHIVEKTSPVDLDATDSQGWTAIHHAVCPLEYGTYDNAEMVFVLIKAGASLNRKDHTGLPPLEYALIRGAPKIAEMIQELGGVELQMQDRPAYSPFEVSDGILGDGKKVDYHGDADRMLALLDESYMDTDLINSRPKPDKNCDTQLAGEVYRDEVKDVTYDVTLTKVDVSCGPFGMYNFYKLQIIRQKGKDLYMLFTRWGRIGDRGQWQHTPFSKPEEAVKEFCKIFKQKTGNDWNQLDKSVNHAKKYHLMPKEEPRHKVKEVKFELASEVPSKLSLAIQDLLQELTSVNMLLDSAKAKGLNKDIMPFGRIQRDVLIAAHKILQQLDELIDVVDRQQKNLCTTPMDDYQSNCEKIASLTNEFYHLVPVGGFEYEVIRPIRDRAVLKEHLKLVTDLLDMEIASKILLGSQLRLKEMNPVDYIYRSIGCKIQVLNENDMETQYILTYINASGHGSRVNAIYKVSRPGEAETMTTRRLDNHRLLWHGTSMANVVSILARGLQIAPADVPITGHLFGQGIYFADSFQKSRSYCYNPTTSVKIALLCEVALGNVMEDITHDEEDHLDQDVNSLKVLGKSVPDQDFDIALPYGVVVPLGQLKPMTYAKPPIMPYNEYVIHDPSQICLRYLVMFDG